MPLSKNICRVCSSRGSYDIFSVIPAYLHGSSNEFLLWKKDIARLLEETTGLSVQPNDNLPTKICALCISYLKHASTFRTQAINNYLSLQTAAQLLEDDVFESKKSDRISNDIMSATDVINSELYSKNEKRIANNSYLNLLFDKDINKNQRIENLEDDETLFAKDFELDECPSASSDENDTDKTNDFFNYKEKSFEEDDILNLLKGYNVIINIPETGKERKCSSCFRRFMFEDTYMDHIEICVEHKLQLTVQALNRLYGLRRKKMISPHEFIRRMFFSLRKISEWISTLVLPERTSKASSELIDPNNKNDSTNLKYSKNELNYKHNELNPQEFQSQSLINDNAEIKCDNVNNSLSKNFVDNSLLEILKTSSSKPKRLKKREVSNIIADVSLNSDIIQSSNNLQTPQYQEQSVNSENEHDKIIALFED